MPNIMKDLEALAARILYSSLVILHSLYLTTNQQNLYSWHYQKVKYWKHNLYSMFRSKVF